MSTETNHKAAAATGDLNGSGRQPCSQGGCEFRSLAGLVRGAGECPFHWAQRQWGTAWAAQCHPTHPEAVAFLRPA